MNKKVRDRFSSGHLKLTGYAYMPLSGFGSGNIATSNHIPLYFLPIFFFDLINITKCKPIIALSF